ncbi:monooxygenase [Paraburkholderia phytofirmans OLGA172]|uniref:Monooxygenase n=1 Tax=Paraburkholderia phytofirmans OLGA172 TaxID=1417228 RepID=A0A160FQ58_9BURK|nr:flavin-dependent oxidoreductase [Paraburkholderia phytofirmans]ANB75010.1 monooxygenase [Paraburkholderia phytofirmans OLGA172]
MKNDCDVLIIGAGVGGLTLALALHEAGIQCRIYEAAPEIKPLGVGINVLPHATRVLGRLGVNDRLAAKSVLTQEASFFNQYGQLIHSEAVGTAAGYDTPQFSIHRGDLQLTLMEVVLERLGADAIVCDRKCVGAESDAAGAQCNFVDAAGNASSVRSSVVVACDGLHSAIRKQFYPDEGAPRYSGINMWRGAVKWKPFLSGATMVRAGALVPGVGKMVIYPIRNNVDEAGNQLVNWVAELNAPQPAKRDWNGQGRLEEFYPAFEKWNFDWLDVAGMIKATTNVLEFPMVDQDPLPRWTFGRVTLLGDAAHPMVPRGSNGAGQAIIDADVLTAKFQKFGVNQVALDSYDDERRQATNAVVLTNRKAPPDKILQVVHERTGGQPFESIGEVISPQELTDITSQYKAVAGYTLDALKTAG